ncbi:HAD family hydrolase [Brachybacterium hainanense]|uniref:HAD family hydrolase n=1 Tax=Brachybacterium hainanense TaxID=1541174 RepID=A0ABV6RFE9_9MICO
MSRKRRTPPRPTVVLDFGGVLSAGHDPVPDLHALLGGDAETLRRAVWEGRPAYDEGRIGRDEYWRGVASAAGLEDLSEEEIAELQEVDDRYFLRLDPLSRALLHDMARSGLRLALLSNASAAFGESVRRADWFEAMSFAIISAEERVAKPEPAIYRILLDVLAHESGGVAVPGSVLFFDDRQDNVDAARALGIDAHLWPRNGEAHPDGVRHGSEIAREVLAGRGIVLD